MKNSFPSRSQLLIMLLSRLYLVFVLLLGSLTARAQTTALPTKIGFADMEYIFSQLPGAKQIDAELKSTETQLINLLQKKRQELEKKYADYVANEKTMLEAVRMNTQRELQQLQANLEKFQQDAQETLQRKQAQLLEPVYEKMSKAIEAVATENKITVILNPRIGATDVLLFADNRTDVSGLVLRKLGVAPPPVADDASNGNPSKQKQ